jgi:hypothetical protein
MSIKFLPLGELPRLGENCPFILGLPNLVFLPDGEWPFFWLPELDLVPLEKGLAGLLAPDGLFGVDILNVGIKSFSKTL